VNWITDSYPGYRVVLVDTANTLTAVSTLMCMPDRSVATRSSVMAAARGLTGSRVTEVTYYGFPAGDEDWDHGQYHDATMGVEFACPDGRRFIACWGDAFGHFGLELLAGTADNTFRNSPQSRDFSAHPWWAPFARSAVSTRIIWRVGYVDRTQDESDEPAPVAITLSCGQHVVWLAAAERADAAASQMSRGGFLLGMDSVLVTADQQLARSVGL
jgi:hypothetical protein